MIDIFKIKKLSNLSFRDKAALSIYPWKNCQPDKITAAKISLSESKVAIVSSAGLYIKGEQNNFDSTIKGGDYSYRKIPVDVKMEQLTDGHRSKSFDHSGLRSNPATGMPIPQLRSLVEEGVIGSLNHRHFSIMGSILAPGRLIKQTIPEIVKHLMSDKVDVVLFLPV